MKFFKILFATHFLFGTISAQVKIEKPISVGTDLIYSNIDTKSPRIFTKELSNGLMVYLVEEKDRPEVFGAVAVRAGGKYDPADATGMGHYLEHMLFKGTTIMGTKDYKSEKVYLDSITYLYGQLKLSESDAARKDILKQINVLSVKASKYAIPNELDRMLQSIGSSGVNAFTSEESIVYHNSFPPNQMEKWLDIYSERFINPVFRLFQAELEIVYEEKNRAMDQFFYYMYMEFLKKLFKNHPYGQQDILGLPEHLKNPDLVKMYEYFNTYNVSNNMALVLVGDFDANSVFRIVEKKFGRWEPGNPKEFPEYKEEPLKGREYFKVRMSPVKIGVIAYRTVTAGDDLIPVLDVVNALLSNQNETGFFNQLKRDNKILEAMTFPLTYNDHGALVTFFIPKIIGQSLNKAEELIVAQIARLASGDFSDELLEAVKLELSRDFAKELESNTSVALNIVESFIRKEDPEKAFQYTQRISKVSKDDIMSFARTYLGENKLVMHSKMGFPKKTKLDKPGFDPVIPEEGEAKSEYAEYFETIQTNDATPIFVDKKRDVNINNSVSNVTIISSENKKNNIGKLDITFQFGIKDHQLLGFAASYLNYLGTETMGFDDMRKNLGKLGCTYSFSADASFMTLSIEGVDQNLPKAMEILGTFLKNPKADDAMLKRVFNEETATRKIEETQASGLGEAMRAYLLYGKDSPFLKRPSKKDFKSITSTQLLDIVSNAINQKAVVKYSGKNNVESISKNYSKYFPLPTLDDGRFGPSEKERVTYSKPQVIFLNKKDAVQSQVYFYIQGDNHTSKDEAQIDAFNSYFGGDMSALVFQEIREFRSLAYSAYARYFAPYYDNQKGYLLGFVGCQADKTIEAVSTMNDLIKNMPHKKERFSAIQNSLIQSLISSKPGFRELPQYVATMLYKNQTKDSRELKYELYPQLTFQNIIDVQEKILKDNVLTIAIVGNKKKVDFNLLKKFGDIVEIKEQDILNK